jgi:hypothetical protein
MFISNAFRVGSIFCPSSIVSVHSHILLTSIPYSYIHIHSMSVSHGAIPALSRMEGHASDPSFQPIIQVINIKSVGAAGGNDRYRVRTVIFMM